MTYAEALSRSMSVMASDPDAIILGQSVAVPGSFMSPTLDKLPQGKLIEMPVTEEMQMGISIGLSLTGFKPVTIYPRWNFLILAANQLVNHLDKLSKYSHGGYQPKVIVRVGVGAKKPLDPGCQHDSNFCEQFKAMMPDCEHFAPRTPFGVLKAYDRAMCNPWPSVITEYAELYDKEES